MLQLLFQIQREDVWAQFDDFRPTPIPLNEWHHDKRDNRAGTLHETIRTSAPPTVAAVPAHYWEDALRHSVYLTLVRDKIDQLIAKGDVISPNSKPNGYDSKEIDDHDLWDKIKSAPFDRIPEEEPASFGDVTIMAKGRLLERNGGFRFAEDERTKEKCSQNNCLQNVKAFWSVKRVRQRDQEMSPGKYHYELTFSVISQTPQKQRKPYENPIRTFTVKESSPAKIYDNPKEHNRFPQAQVSRPERAIWVHKNIAPSKFVGRKQYVSGLERIFSSLFSDDDDRSYETPTTKYKQNSYFPPPGASQYSKIGHAGIPVDAHQHIPYPYRPQPIKHVRPPLQAPPTNINQYQYQEIQGSPTTASSIPYVQYPYDHRQESSQMGKTTRPAVLPTPLPPISPSMEQSAESINTMSMENVNNTFRPDGIRFHKTYNKYNTPVKVNYFSDHVRPPVYNAPPGVFVTMDKKPFKPMPPLKLVHSKPHKTYKPKDFRPSPQIVDQPPDEDLFSETDFRPMKINFSDDASSQKSVITHTNKKTESKIRKPSTTVKKHPKKHDNVKNHRFTPTTAVPDIITAQINVEEEIENMAWANILGSLTKTTPIDPQTETPIIEVTTPMTTSTTKTTLTPQKKVSTTTEAEREITTSTTMKPKRRTRPPPKFTKEKEKVKKHKRITTTTTTTTTNAPESAVKRRPTNDFTLQASSSPIIPLKPRSTSTSTTPTTTTTSSTTTTTSKPTTTKTTTQTPTTSKPTVSTTQPKNKNRFRQSTLMIKGTSVKHDRWSTNAMQKNQTATTSMTPSSYLHRRKGSNFQGYVSSTTTRYIDEEKEREREKHIDHKLRTSPTEITTKMSEIASQTNMYEETVDQYEVNNVMPLQKVEENNNDNIDSEEESKDKAEYIFEPTLSQVTVNNKDEDQTTPKSKSKCKRKKQNISTTVISSSEESETTTETALIPNLISANNSKDMTTTESDILQDFMNYSFSENDKTTTAELLREESSNHESYAKFEDDLKDFLGVFKDEKAKEESLIDNEYSEEESDDNQDDEDIENNDQDSDEDDSESDEDDYEESKIPSIDDDIGFNSDEDKETTDDLQYKDESEPKAHSYSFLELMAMS